MIFDIITLFPQMFGSFFSGGIIRKALDKGLIDIRVHYLREYSHSKHKQVDDRPFGGGQGMVLKPEPIFEAVGSIRGEERIPAYLLSPQGKRFDIRMAEELAQVSRLILICGRYEGVDERVVQYLITDELSIGDYILTGGEPAAAVVIDAVSRFVPKVVGKAESVRKDSFIKGVFDYPQYTRPRKYKGMGVPEVLFSGDHREIKRWRRKKSLEKTWSIRPDLIDEKKLSGEEKEMLDEIKKERKGP